MKFKYFIQKLGAVIRLGNSTYSFTKTIFEAIVTEEGHDILDGYSPSSYKSFYNGNTSINSISQKISAYIDPMEFENFIRDFPDATVGNLCNVFSDDIPSITPFNAAEKLSELFITIITEAAATEKEYKKRAMHSPTETGDTGIATKEYTSKNTDSTFSDKKEYVKYFKSYLEKATSYYSTKKTLLYAEKPHPFYDLYVCNDIEYNKYRMTSMKDHHQEVIISNATIEKLEAESKYIIIEGIGGIGKSMFLTHLFLSATTRCEQTGAIPLLLSLKDYRDNTSNMVDFIFNSLCEYDSSISKKNIIRALQDGQLILLLDGFDEIHTSIRDSFQSDLEAFIKSYNDNTVIITSRPIYDFFVSFSKFSVFDIKPLTKVQSLELIDKLEFWDNIAKRNFIDALNSTLYYSHRQFASNPLLLTIMLMTYSSFGEVPAKMHVFYSKAYETMARLHDASKGSFKRPLHTNLSPEEFSKYFAEFCARTYQYEILEFDERSFTSFMMKVINRNSDKINMITAHDFLLDLTDNLCIMYKEGNMYYFIHRSFQEYFAAVHFASEYDTKLTKIGDFFEGMRNRNYSDKTFDMIYDMIPEKVERFIFLPFLEKLIKEYSENIDEEYWAFLENQYPTINHEEGETGEIYILTPQSFLYEAILKFKKIDFSYEMESVSWPKQIYELPTQKWVEIYSEFIDDEAFHQYPDTINIDERLLVDTELVTEDQVPYQYEQYFGSPNVTGIMIQIDTSDIKKYPYKYREIKKCFEDDEFPLMLEYKSVTKYYHELKIKTERENASEDLFDD